MQGGRKEEEMDVARLSRERERERERERGKAGEEAVLEGGEARNGGSWRKKDGEGDGEIGWQVEGG